jgi:hypothetical protein
MRVVSPFGNFGNALFTSYSEGNFEAYQLFLGFRSVSVEEIQGNFFLVS